MFLVAEFTKLLMYYYKLVRVNAEGWWVRVSVKDNPVRVTH